MKHPVRLDLPHDDDRDLVSEGYRPMFRRGLGSFTAFAAGFSYLSILTGIVQNFYLGYGAAGPASIWTWPVVFLGQLCLAICFANLSREYPFCGGIYAWSRRTGSPFLGWLTGWVYLASLVVTLAAVALAWQIVLPPLWSGFQILESPSQNAAVLGAILIAISTLLNAIGTRWMALLMNIGVVVELIAAVALITLLGGNSVRGFDAFLFHSSPLPGESTGGITPFLAAAVMSAYVMYGFDTAGTLAEETKQPKRRTGRAILQALIAAAGLGMLMLLFAVTSAPNLFDPMIGKLEGGFPYLMKQVLGESMGRVFIAASVVAIFVCTLAVQANTARVLFAMARDKSVPWASWLGRVDPKTQSPQKAALVIGVIAGGLLLFNMNNDKLMTALICVSIVWANLAYLFTTAPLFVRRWSNRKRHERSPARSWVFLAVNGLAVIWGVILLTNIGWPRESLYGEEWYMKYAAPLFTAGLLGIGVLVHQQLKVLHARGDTV